ncbi:nicotianamine aminotransferase 1-like isoform X2 [Hordeum vulgare subsp. vulgare]|uniref:nicotianamine aminotransferase 1-like isoform X2 n=1 Tax=Hordeum vulgare subsp. vulgare TaxID=112509 RepID=UPI001D1A4A10|nr:nicotianamine aminotransferase 1-like isoform X2 [Hordeum vulgare subsp. vulgare]
MSNGAMHQPTPAPEMWNFAPDEALLGLSALSVRSVLGSIKAGMDPSDGRPVIPLGHGDPSAFPCFRTAPEAVEAVSAALHSGMHNCYPTGVGLEPARRSIARHLSLDLPYELSPDDVYLTSGCCQAIEIVCSVLAGRPGAASSNILLPRPGYLFYEARAAFNGMEARYFHLLPDSDWEADLDAVEALADRNTVAMVLVNPGNPCGNVYTYDHLAKVAETARKLGIFVIADEVYAHLTFGKKRFVPMGVFGSVAPVLTLGSISKRWVVPGWRLGWIVTNDPHGVFRRTKGAIPELLEKTKQEFFDNTVDILRQTADICWEKLKGISGITCPSKPEGSMFVMVKLDFSCLQDIKDDMDFCCKLAKEEAVLVLPALKSRFVQGVLWDTRIGSGSRLQSDRLLSKTALTGSSPSARDTARQRSDAVSSQVPCKTRHLLSYK